MGQAWRKNARYFLGKRKPNLSATVRFDEERLTDRHNRCHWSVKTESQFRLKLACGDGSPRRAKLLRVNVLAKIMAAS